MDNRLLVFPNITVAVRAKNILEVSGIRGFVQKVPKINGKSSCNYGVFVPKYADKAEIILRNKGFVILDRIGRSDI